MKTFITVLFIVFFGFILIKGLIMIFKKKIPAQKSSDGISYPPSEPEEQDGGNDKDNFEQFQK